jgi:hypothetical protein
MGEIVDGMVYWLEFDWWKLVLCFGKGLGLVLSCEMLFLRVGLVEYRVWGIVSADIMEEARSINNSGGVSPICKGCGCWGGYAGY